MTIALVDVDAIGIAGDMNVRHVHSERLTPPYEGRSASYCTVSAKRRQMADKRPTRLPAPHNNVRNHLQSSISIPIAIGAMAKGFRVARTFWLVHTVIYWALLPSQKRNRFGVATSLNATPNGEMLTDSEAVRLNVFSHALRLVAIANCNISACFHLFKTASIRTATPHLEPAHLEMAVPLPAAARSKRLDDRPAEYAMRRAC